MAMPGITIAAADPQRKRIEIMAEHIARNGPDFEALVKSKNVNNPQFAFLYGGEGSEYYQQVLAAHRKAVATAPPGTAVATTAAAAAAASDVVDVADLAQRWREPPIFPLAADVERQLTEVVSSLEQMASRDAIRNGRVWIECNAGIVQQIASNVMKRVAYLSTCAHRLHVLYLVHDVLQTEAARKDVAKPLIRGFKPYLVWILRPAYQLALAQAAGTDESGKVLRLLQLWVERAILTSREADEIKALMLATEIPGASGAAAASNRALSRPSLPTVRPQAGGFSPAGGAAAAAATAGLLANAGRGTALVPGARPAMPGQLGVSTAYGSVAPFVSAGPGARPLMPGLGVPPGFHAVGYRPQMMQQAPMGKQTPETVPVGIMATMMRQALRRVREARQSFVAYKPLETACTPQMLPPMEVPTQRLLERVKDFYEDLRDEDRDSSSSRSRSASSSRSRSRSRSATRSRSRNRDAGSISGNMAMNLGGMIGQMSAVPPPALD